MHAKPTGANGATELQKCRDCGQLFPHDPDADRCPSCVFEALCEKEDSGGDGHDHDA
jgi:hypothetical protein